MTHARANKQRHLWIGFCLLVALHHPLLASGSRAGASSPTMEAEKVFREYFEAMRSTDWSKASGYMHPEALEAFQRVMGLIVEADPDGEAARSIFRLKPGQSLESLPPSAAFQRLMEFLVAQAPMFKEILASSRVSIIGTLAEGELVHVVHRHHMTAEGGALSKVVVVTLKRDGAAFKAMLSAEMEGTLSNLVQRLGKPGGA